MRLRVVMLWHSKEVLQGLVLDGLQVRWRYVARLLQSLCAFARGGYGSWRLGGKEGELMHKFYDPRVFDSLSEEDLKCQYAPKVTRAGELLQDQEIDRLSPEAKIEASVDATTVEQFVASGFDVRMGLLMLKRERAKFRRMMCWKRMCSVAGLRLVIFRSVVL